MTTIPAISQADKDIIREFTLKTVELWEAIKHPQRSAPRDDFRQQSVTLSSGHHLSFTLPGMSIESFCDRFGPRILAWPHGVECRRRISVVSSRLRKRKDLHPYWFEALRTLVARCNPTEECLCVFDQTAAASAVRCAARLFGVQLIPISAAEHQLFEVEDLVKWLFQNISTQAPRNTLESPLVLSPMYVGTSEQPMERAGINADELLVSAGQRVVALSCRNEGNIHMALRNRLNSKPVVPVLLLDHKSAISTRTRAALHNAGAVPWILDRDTTVESTVPNGSCDTVVEKTPPSNGPLQCPDEWLCHWTRCCPGPWPDETQDDYLDTLIIGFPSSDHSAVAALLRIVESATLLPSELSRGTVSFTAVGLTEFRARRIYRRHLRRHDFEPWGIAVRRSVLKRLGCLPVIYVDASSEPDDPFELWRRHPATDASRRIEWTQEKEWRHPGPVDLLAMDECDIVVFVDDETTARSVRRCSPWPVVIVPKHSDL